MTDPLRSSSLLSSSQLIALSFHTSGQMERGEGKPRVRESKDEGKRRHFCTVRQNDGIEKEVQNGAMDVCVCVCGGGTSFILSITHKSYHSAEQRKKKKKTQHDRMQTLLSFS